MAVITVPCSSTHHSSDPALRKMSQARDGHTCPSCRGTEKVKKCTVCLAVGCDGAGCPDCANCDDTKKSTCPRCDGGELEDDDTDCRKCRGTGKVRCPKC